MVFRDSSFANSADKINVSEIQRIITSYESEGSVVWEEIRDFKDRDIDYEINLKCNSTDTVRAARINTSKRLYEYAENGN